MRLRYHHQSGTKQDWKIEYWPGDEQWRSSLHFHWNWLGRGHWLCIFLPECSVVAIWFAFFAIATIVIITMLLWRSIRGM